MLYESLEWISNWGVVLQKSWFILAMITHQLAVQVAQQKFTSTLIGCGAKLDNCTTRNSAPNLKNSVSWTLNGQVSTKRPNKEKANQVKIEKWSQNFQKIKLMSLKLLENLDCSTVEPLYVFSIAQSAKLSVHYWKSSMRLLSSAMLPVERMRG